MMVVPLRKTGQLHTGRDSSGQLLPGVVVEREARTEIELEIWEQKVHKDAQQEACRKGGTLAIGGIEAQLRRVSEEVTHEAQEKLK